MNQMSYVGGIIDPDEHIVHIATLHWIIFMPGLILAFAGGGFSFYSYTAASILITGPLAPLVGKIGAGIALGFTLVGFALLVGAFVRQASTELVITDHRIIAKYGFISRATYEIMVNRISGVNFDQTVVGRIFGYGTILVHGSGGDVSPFDGVSDPQRFQAALMDVLQKLSKKENQRSFAG